MKILIICHSYKPNNDPRSLRWTALSEEFITLGNEVHVITNNPYQLKKKELCNGVNIYRLGGGWSSFLRFWVNKKVSSINVDSMIISSESKSSYQYLKIVNNLKKIIRFIYDVTIKNIYWPDGDFQFIIPAFRLSKFLLNKYKFDALISVSHPFSSHVVAFFIQKKIKNLRWLADSGDPFSFLKESSPNNFKIYRKLNYKIEHKILRSADCFSVTTFNTASLYQKIFPEFANKVKVFPPLLNSLFLSAPKVNKYFSENAIIILFVGRFYNDIRSPIPLLNLLERLLNYSDKLEERIQLHIIGPSIIDEKLIQDRPILRNKIFFHGQVPHINAIEAMFSANFLVNIGNITLFQLPSKVVEYMATGRPILNICNTETDSSHALLLNYPLYYNWIINISNDIESLCDFIIEHQKSKLSNFEIQNQISLFNQHDIAKLYLNELFIINDENRVSL
jgi:hypothetical protein